MTEVSLSEIRWPRRRRNDATRCARSRQCEGYTCAGFTLPLRGYHLDMTEIMSSYDATKYWAIPRGFDQRQQRTLSSAMDNDVSFSDAADDVEVETANDRSITGRTYARVDMSVHPTACRRRKCCTGSVGSLQATLLFPSKDQSATASDQTSVATVNRIAMSD